MAAVDAMTKWVEVGALRDKASATVAAWFHENITCRYGPPARVRSDRGREFMGAFTQYLEGIGCKQNFIFSAHPRANGLVKRYNKCIKEGLRKFVVAAGAKFAWTDFLGDIVAGLRMLPTRIGYSPFLLVFKQSPHWGAWGEHAGIGVPDIRADPVDGELITQQLAWWGLAAGAAPPHCTQPADGAGIPWEARPQR